MTTAARPIASENEILQCIDQLFINEHPALNLGRGDDCAIFGDDYCVSSDLFIENVHFRRAYFEPDEIGHKALAVNISDLAGMGARPVFFNLNLGIPPGASMDWLERLLAGMAHLAKLYDMILCGGDISTSKNLIISISAFGQRPDNCSLLRRGGVMPGDILFLSGNIGLARIGLEELEKAGRQACEKWPAACAAHLMPKPEVGPGLILARAGHNARPPALLDVSDGLAADLPRLLGHKPGQPGLGAVLDINPEDLHEEARQHAAQNGRDPVLEAYKGGEDYALLGACAPDMIPPLRAAMPGLRRIGVATPPQAIILNGQPVQATGFDHFRGN